MKKKFVMIALLPSNTVEAFKGDVLAVCPDAKCYNALTYGIRCQQEAIAVELSGTNAEQAEICNLLASDYHVEFPLVQPVQRDSSDKVCTFSVPPRSYGSGDSLLVMWDRCHKACAALTEEARRQLSFSIYLDGAENTINFQACYSAENDFEAWQQAISDFCLAFMADSSGCLKVSFDKCKLLKSR